MENISVREAVENDIDRLVELKMALQVFIEKCNSNLRKHSEKMSELVKNQYIEHIKSEDAQIIVIEDRKRNLLVGLGVGKVDIYEEVVPSISGRIDDIWIEENYRGRGLSKMIVKSLVNFFKIKGCSSISLDYVTGNDKSEDLWKHFGFRPVLTIANARVDEILDKL